MGNPSDEDPLFRRESGEFKAISSDIEEILATTRQVVEKMHTDPPPAIASRLRGAGLYQYTGRAAPVEQIRTGSRKLKKD